MLGKTGNSGTLTVPTSSLPINSDLIEFKDENYFAPNTSTGSYSHSTNASSSNSGTLVTELFTNVFSLIQDIVKVFLPKLTGNDGSTGNTDSNILNKDNLSNVLDVPGKTAKDKKNVQPIKLNELLEVDTNNNDSNTYALHE